MNLLDLRSEVAARGFDFDTPTRVNAWVNRVLHRAYERHPWPFLETTTTGVSPLTISDVRNVLSVVDTVTKEPLSWEDPRALLERDPTLAATGNPTSWYLEGSALTVYPANTTDTLSVRYIKVAPDLSADSDSPLFPTRFHYCLVDGAVAMAYEDTDNFDAASICWASFWGCLDEAAATLLVPNFDTAADLPLYGSPDY